MIQVIWTPPDRISMDEWYRDKRDTFGSWNVNAMIGWCDIEMWNVSLYPTGLTSPISWSAEDRLFAISNRNSYGRFSFKISLVCQLRFKEVTQKIKKNQKKQLRIILPFQRDVSRVLYRGRNLSLASWSLGHSASGGADDDDLGNL